MNVYPVILIPDSVGRGFTIRSASTLTVWKLSDETLSILLTNSKILLENQAFWSVGQYSVVV